MRSYFKQKKSVTLDLIFKCTKCNKHFATQNGQYKHYRTHSLGKYVCTICKKRFQYPKNLTDHKATHNPNLFIKCTVPGCGKKYCCIVVVYYCSYINKTKFSVGCVMELAFQLTHNSRSSIGYQTVTDAHENKGLKGSNSLL